MKKMQHAETAVVPSRQETRRAVVAMAQLEHAPRVIARRLEIEEVEVTTTLVREIGRAYRRGLERGRLSAMPNLPRVAA